MYCLQWSNENRPLFNSIPKSCKFWFQGGKFGSWALTSFCNLCSHHWHRCSITTSPMPIINPRQMTIYTCDSYTVRGRHSFGTSIATFVLPINFLLEFWSSIWTDVLNLVTHAVSFGMALKGTENIIWMGSLATYQ